MGLFCNLLRNPSLGDVMHYRLLSVHPSCANHNSIMEHSTKLKLLGEVTLTSSNWQNNFVVKKSRLLGAEIWKSFLAHIFAKNALIHVRPRPRWPPPPFHAARFVQYTAAAKMCTFRENQATIFWSRQMLCAFNCDRPHYGRAVCMQDAIQPTAVGACMVTQAQTATYRIAVLRYTITCLCYDPHPKKEQELSYCKQIVRQLRTQ